MLKLLCMYIDCRGCYECEAAMNVEAAMNFEAGIDVGLLSMLRLP